MHSSQLLSVLAGLAGVAQAAVWPRSTSDPFQIYAFGDGIGGVPLISSGKSAYIGDYSLLNDTEAAPVLFTSDTNGIWVGAPNTTGFADSSDLPTWSDLCFYVPKSSSSSHAVGLVDISAGKNATLVTSGFDFYGTLAYLTGASGQMVTLWYAVPSDTEGLYSLRWNTTGESVDGAVLLTLKSSPPSNA
ncbi:hypothetical protein BKA56DRAFT_734437 [Ilyonectria sp. MPI-CAGE-AT-0026]|nr:hypothetical protein BKA56DRAFT_734437 [Ilyonectria sp. MPI-CAGE-AT-0026]